MDFFEHQEKARKKTFFLVLYFILAIVLIILAIDAVTIGAIISVGLDKNIPLLPLSYSTGNPLFDLSLIMSLIVSPIVIGVIVVGTLVKIYTLRNGGISVAEMVKAKPISPDTHDPLEQRFLNVVEEMSIASGVRVPKLYVIDEESINAFVAGLTPKDTVMVVTRGALEQLDRDELQGVIGHEFSHIFNCDMQISLKLMGLLGGLLFISQSGYIMLRLFGRNRSANSRQDGRFMLGLLMVGVGLYVIGYIGLFFGRLIKAAVSRQRELLADAQSVQYSRNPDGLISALKQIQISTTGTYLSPNFAEDLSHFCFCPSLSMAFSDLLASHPPLEERIKILDPNNQFQFKAAKASISSPTKPIQPIISSAPLVGGLTDSAAITSSIGDPTNAHLEKAQHLIALFPQNLLSFAHNPLPVSILLYAMAIQNSPAEKITPLLKATLENDKIQNILNLNKVIKSLPHEALLPLLDIALPAFKTLDTYSQNKTLQLLQNILANLNQQDLFQFALHAIISKIINGKTKSPNKQLDYTTLIPEISKLVALFIANGNKDESESISLYNKIMNDFTLKPLPFLAAKEFDPANLQLILSKLNQLTPRGKQKIIYATLECIQADNKIAVTEAELIRAIAACLDCPIPPILPH